MERHLRASFDGAPHLVRVDSAGAILEFRPLPGEARRAEPRLTLGFTDLHNHGGAGYGFDTADEVGIGAALALHREHGSTGVVLSLVSEAPCRLVDRLAYLRHVVAALPAALGVHLEGPFLAAGRRGAHDPAALMAPTASVVESIIEAGDGLVRQITIAPELPGALDAIDRFVAAGVVVAVGHTQADHDGAAAAFDRGASVLTHAFNAMAGLGHREPGPVGAALSREHVVIEIIADGMHVHPVVLRALFASAPGRVALVSDAMSATGLGDGVYRLGGLEVDVRAGRPVLTGTDTLAGSTLTLDRAVEVAVDSGVPVDEAIAAATTIPRSVLGTAAPSIAPGTPLSAVVAIDGAGRVTSLLDSIG